MHVWNRCNGTYLVSGLDIYIYILFVNKSQTFTVAFAPAVTGTYFEAEVQIIFGTVCVRIIRVGFLQQVINVCVYLVYSIMLVNVLYKICYRLVHECTVYFSYVLLGGEGSYISHNEILQFPTMMYCTRTVYPPSTSIHNFRDSLAIFAETGNSV